MRKITVIEAPIASGSPTRGTEKAFQNLRENGLSDIFAAEPEYIDADYIEEKQTGWEDNLKHLEEVITVAGTVRENVLKACESGNFPLLLGGDHSISMGSIAAVSEVVGLEELTVIWVDAHSDINTEVSTVSGFIHGMPIAAAMGLCCDTLTVGKQKCNLLGKNFRIFGGRSIEPQEYVILEQQSSIVYEMEEIRAAGFEQALERLIASIDTKYVHVSFDVDCLDPAYFTATGYVLENGLSPEEVKTVLTRLVETGKVVSADCVEYNPTIDPSGEGRAVVLDILSALAGAVEGQSKRD